MRITLRQIAVFEAVARTGSVAGAADEIGLSPSAASMSLKDLETHLGVQLFARSGRRMMLTDRGRPMLEMARGILVQVADLESLSLPEEVRGRLRIGAAVPVGDYVLPGIWATRMPQIPLNGAFVCVDNNRRCPPVNGSGQGKSGLTCVSY